MNPLELRQKRADLVAKARAILKKAEDEKRQELTAEEKQETDRIFAEADKLHDSIKLAERVAQAEYELRSSEGRRAEPGDPGDHRGGQDRKAPQTDAERRSTPEYRKMVDVFLREGHRSFGPAEYRAMQADSDVIGGYLVAPQEMYDGLIKFVDDAVVMRQLATKVTVTSAESLGVPSLDTDVADSDWTSEVLTGSEDSSLALGKRELHPHPLAKRIKISRKLLRLAPKASELVQGRLNYKFALTEEKAFLTGNGNQKPLGVFTASDHGIPTSRDVVGGTTTALTADKLIDVFYAQKPQYQKSSSWLFHRDAMKQIRKLADTTGQYLWQVSIQDGEPDKLLGRPVYQSEYVPSTFTTGLYVGMFADFSFYFIADAVGLGIQRLDELYAETNQVGFIGRVELDGMPALAEAFTRIKLA